MPGKGDVTMTNWSRQERNSLRESASTLSQLLSESEPETASAPAAAAGRVSDYHLIPSPYLPEGLQVGPTSSCQCSQAGPGVPQLQQARHLERTGASGAGRF